MKRTLFLTLLSGFIATLLLVLILAAVKALFGLEFGRAVSFLIVWATMVAIIIFDDVFIIPTASKIAEKLGLDKLIKE